MKVLLPLFVMLMAFSSSAFAAVSIDFTDVLADIAIVIVALIGLAVAKKGGRAVISMIGG